MSDLFVKPYFYLAPYVNGLLAGLVTGTNNFMHKHEIFHSLTEKLSKNCLLSLMILAMTLFCQKTPLLSALQTSLPQILISLTICSYLLRNEFPKVINILSEFTIWNKWRPLVRASYLFHPLLFDFLAFIFPIKNFNFFITIIHFILVLKLNYYISYFIINSFDKPFTKLIYKQFS